MKEMNNIKKTIIYFVFIHYTVLSKKIQNKTKQKDQKK